MQNLRSSAIANRAASEKNGSYKYDTLVNCTIEKVASWEYDDIEVVGVKFSDAEGSMQLNCRMQDVNYEGLKALEGSVCDIRAKIWLNAEGVAEYDGNPTIWSFASASVVPVLANDGIVRGAVSPK